MCFFFPPLWTGTIKSAVFSWLHVSSVYRTLPYVLGRPKRQNVVDSFRYSPMMRIRVVSRKYFAIYITAGTRM